MVDNSETLETLLRVAVEAVTAGSRALMDRFRPPEGAALAVTYKGTADPVTDADIASDRAIASVLNQPGVPGDILSEESSLDRGEGRLTWFIDPLCGTIPFSTGLPHWGPSVALGDGTNFLVGAIALPTTNDLLSSAMGRGAFLNGQPLKVHEPPGALGDVGIVIDVVHRRKMIPALHAMEEASGRRFSFGSAVYPIAQLLLGRLHGVVFASGLSVHTAGGAAIASELGVRVTDVDGNEPLWNADGAEVGSLVLAWPRTHEALLRIAAEAKA
ncbi:MAG: inositol monophosphatase family protein [Chloroflexi bacterium]|nr:inositol monophosphatase family protein [Chloroflexota bacterium]